MTTVTAVLLLLVVLGGVAVLLERADRRAAGLPRDPFGAERDRNVDLARVLHDLDVHRWA